MTATTRIRRSLLFVPGAEPRKLERARSTAADTVLFDLEDSVGPEQKDEARALVAELLAGGVPAEVEWAVRVNPPGTPFHEADVDEVVTAGARTLMIPKCADRRTLTVLDQRLEALERELGLEVGAVRLLALVETAAGIARALEVAESSGRVEALCFGHADFALDMGLPDADPAGGVIFHARASLAIAARAAGLQPIDNVCLAIRDAEVLHRDVALGQSLGYEGKLCIHPVQVEIANELYTPSATSVDFARRVVEGWERAREQGLGVFVVDHKMVDAPLVAMQRRVLERALKARRGGQEHG